MRTLSIRNRLLAAAAAVALGGAALAGVAVVTGQRNGQAMHSIVEGNLKPLLAIQRVDGTLSAVRFRAAGVLLDHFPLPGTVNHLKESTQVIADAWKVVDAQPTASAEEDALLKQLRDGYPGLRKMLDGLDKAYAKGDKPGIEELLQSDWAAVHKNFVKPMVALMAVQEKASEATLAAAQRNNRQHTLAAVLAKTLFAERTMKYYAELESRISDLDIEDVNAALRKYIDPERLVVVTAGDFSKVNK